MHPKMPWLLNLATSTMLVLSQSHFDNTYQASIDESVYSQTGKLRMLLLKPESGFGGLVTICGGLSAIYSLYKLLEGDEPNSAKITKPRRDKDSEESEPSNPESEPISSEDSELDEDSEAIADEEQIEADKPEASDSEPNLFSRVWHHRKRHLLIPAETGAGKTTLLLGLLKYFHQQSKGTVEIYGSTAKPSPWMGLEFEKAPDNRPRIINLEITNPRSIELLLARLRWIQKRMQQRQQKRAKAEAENKPYSPNRVVMVFDEWNTTLAIARRFDKILQRELNAAKAEKKAASVQAPYAEDELKSLTESILLMGREDECAIWVFGQDHQVQNAGFNTGYQKSFGVIVPFRKGTTQALEQALIGRSPVLPMAVGKTVLEQGYEQLNSNPNSTLVYSNLNGHEILECPYLPNIKREKLNGAEQPKQPAAVSESTESAAVSESEDPWEE